MNNYRLTILVKNDLEEKDRKALLDDAVKSFGKLSKEDMWGTRTLMYPIMHKNQAFYAHYEFESEPSSIAPLDKKLKLNEDILRYLLLRVEIKKARKAKKITKKVEEISKES